MDEPELIRRVVRRFGADRTHVVEVPAAILIEDVFITPFVGVQLPAVALCGATLRSATGDVAICMKEGSRIRCASCRRRSGLDVAPAGNHRLGEIRHGRSV